ncbi:tRNA pseudouridine(55) synthase TruB [Paenibacillus koleovorans]|uniref:tRNA pseudouridine(55) synthase TruB n=1 Tax=Paenibacillus koleovorans TaxID=121608 RepID=UPI000FDB96CA|nr:tRNA pseudouridine(55) synthase TruB [Paenibacillus koleovorans]
MSKAKRAEASYEGVLPVLKPPGFTSHDVVAKARRLLGMKRIGHTGTLDPQVTGVLPLCLGRATRVVEYIQELPKEYEAELTIGYATDTEDWTGQVTAQVERAELSREQLLEVLQRFVGSIEQVPPMYSAVRVDGKRLYELARQGQEVERTARTVQIYRLELLHSELELDHPKVRFRVLCSKGTYIRTLCVDIGRALGYPSVMSELVRTSTGQIALERCLSLPDIERLVQAGELEQHLIPTDQAIAHLPKLQVDAAAALHASQGKTIRVAAAATAEDDAGTSGLVRLYNEDGTFLGIFDNQPEQHGQWRLQPEKVFV